MTRPFVLPDSTRAVIAGSRFRLLPQPVRYARVAAVCAAERHLMVVRDDREITLVSDEAGLALEAPLEVNPDRWALFQVDCANPFYCVGFIAHAASLLAAHGLDVLVVSTFSRDYFMVLDAERERVRHLLLEVGFAEATD